MALRLNSLFRIGALPSNYCHRNTPYYEYSINTIRKCVPLKDFPNIASKNIYDLLYIDTQPEIEKMYPNYNWKDNWKKVTFNIY